MKIQTDSGRKVKGNKYPFIPLGKRKSELYWIHKAYISEGMKAKKTEKTHLYSFHKILIGHGIVLDVLQITLLFIMCLKSIIWHLKRIKPNTTCQLMLVTAAAAAAAAGNLHFQVQQFNAQFSIFL